MPLYTSHCGECGQFHSYVRTVAERNSTPECCGKPSEKRLDTPMIGAMSFGGHKGFVADATDTPTWIESGSAMKRYMKENDLVPTGEASQEARIRREAREVEVDKKLDQAIEKAAAIHGF